MFSPKRLAAILGTLVAAFGIGFVMQSYLAPDRHEPSAGVQVASVSPMTQMAPSDAAPVLATDAVNDLPPELPPLAGAIPMPPPAAPQPGPLPGDPVTLAALSDASAGAVPGILPAEEPAPRFGCDLVLEARPVAAAMVRLTLSAPCLAEERFALHHGGMMFAALTDADGNAEHTVPALSETAVFIATFATGDSAVARAEMSTLEYYHRVVVQWSGTEGLGIHALEYGADYEESGHVWAGAARDMAAAARGEGGFVTRLGDPEVFEPMLAEVYTFPLGTALNEGEIRMSVEAEVTAANCGRDIEAQILQKSGTERMSVRELTLAMPDCDATGDYLVLKNIVDDLNIARN